MTAASLPPAVQDTFRRFVTTELTTIDVGGRPVTWPVTPFYRAGDPRIDVTTGIGWPRKARDAERNPRVSLLFSDATGSGIDRPSMVLVQGLAEVDDKDLEANRERYARDAAAKLGGGRAGGPPPEGLQRRFDWYYTRIYLHVLPQRVLVWRGGDVGMEPQLLLDERPGPSGPPQPPRRREPERGPRDRRIREMGRRYDSAVLSFVDDAGYPFSVRVPVGADRRGHAVHIDEEPVGVDLREGPVCLTAHDHEEALRWQRNFQVRGDLERTASGGWVVVPRRIVHGFELPPVGALTRTVSNFGRIRRYRRTARRERERRARGG